MLKRGIARYMMQVVDALVKNSGYAHVFLLVFSMHKHLLDMYTQWGFNIIGTKALSEVVNQPGKYIVSCHLIIMEKDLS
jgi:hypothetical protein